MNDGFHRVQTSNVTASNTAVLSPHAGAQLRVPMKLRHCRSRGNALPPLAIAALLPTGAWREGDVALRVSGDGPHVPCQTKALAGWPDDSVKWLLAKSLHRPRTAETAELVLQTRAVGHDRGPHAPQLEAKRADSSEIAVNTGAARFRFHKAGWMAET
jgi:hypothetical protein